MSELISVIVPIYNVEKYLQKCVDSILSQTYKNIEVILVDDGSPDKCGQMCDSYKDKDNRIKVMHKKNGGLSDARNAGIEIADGNYIMFIDSDDYILNNMIETLYSRIIKDKSDVAECNFLYVDGDGNEIKERNKNMPFQDEVITSDEAMERLFSDKYWYLVTAWNKLYKRELFSEIRFPYGKYHEDEFVVHLVIEKCKSISLIKEPLYCYSQRNNSIMGSKFNIRNLDGAEAFLNRAKMLAENNNSKLAAGTLRMALSVLRKGCDLEHSETVNKKIKELKKYYNTVYRQISLKRIGALNRFILTSAYPNIYVYNFITKNILKK